MIDQVLVFLKDQINDYLPIKTDAPDNNVVFLGTTQAESAVLAKNAITVLLINLEEERTFRSGSMSSIVIESNMNHPLNPDLSLNLYVLFAANFEDYSKNLQYLSTVIAFFQSHPIFESHNYPALHSDSDNSGIEKLTMEFVSLPWDQLRNVWSVLGMTYKPSVIYKVRMIVFRELEPVEVTLQTTDIQINLHSSQNVTSAK